MSKNINVKFQEHLKLYVLFQDNIIFENELLGRQIDYFYDSDQVFASGSIRYFLLEKDRRAIDLLLKENDIIATIESLGIQDFRLERKVQNLYLKVALIVAVLMIIIFFIYDKAVKP